MTAFPKSKMTNDINDHIRQTESGGLLILYYFCFVFLKFQIIFVLL